MTEWVILSNKTCIGFKVLFQEIDMKNLIFWASNGYDELHNNPYIPSLEQCTFKESIPKCKSDLEWMEESEQDESIPLPAKVYLEIKSIKKIDFDLFEYDTHLIVVSNKLLEFLQKHGFNSGYDTCPVSIVNTKGELLTQEDFYLIRVFEETSQAHNELIIAEEPTPTRPEFSPFFEQQPFATVYTHSEQKIFMPSMIYQPALMFSEDLLDELKSAFNNPRLYTALEWIDSEKKMAEGLGF